VRPHLVGVQFDTDRLAGQPTDLDASNPFHSLEALADDVLEEGLDVVVGTARHPERNHGDIGLEIEAKDPVPLAPLGQCRSQSLHPICDVGIDLVSRRISRDGDGDAAAIGTREATYPGEAGNRPEEFLGGFGDSFGDLQRRRFPYSDVNGDRPVDKSWRKKLERGRYERDPANYHDGEQQHQHHHRSIEEPSRS